MPEAELAEALRAVSSAKHYQRWLFRKIGPDLGAVVLDIGSGLGDLSEFLSGKARDRRVILSDASGAMVKELRDRYDGASHVRVAQLDITDKVSLEVFPEGWVPDTVTCLNVLEHIEDDGGALRNMRDLVSRGGKVVLFVPALDWLYGSLDRMAGHHRRYTRKGLARKLEAAGLRVLKMEYFNLPGILTWFLGGKIFRQTRLDAGVCSGLDKLVPCISLPERFIAPPFGQSLIAVASAA